MLRKSLLLFSLALLVAGCAPRAAGDGSQTARERQGVITREEVERGPQSNAYDLVLALRPQWLRQRGPTSLGFSGNARVRVYVDDVRFGEDPEQLRRIPVPSIESLRFYDSMEASNRWGLDHGSGAIVVNTRR